MEHVTTRKCTSNDDTRPTHLCALSLPFPNRPWYFDVVSPLTLKFYINAKKQTLYIILSVCVSNGEKIWILVTLLIFCISLQKPRCSFETPRSSKPVDLRVGGRRPVKQPALFQTRDIARCSALFTFYPLLSHHVLHHITWPDIIISLSRLVFFLTKGWSNTGRLYMEGDNRICKCKARGPFGSS